MFKLNKLILPIVLIVLWFSGCANSETAQSNKIKIEYYYFNTCNDCDKEADFINSFEEITGINADTHSFDIVFSNVYFPSKVEPFNSRMNELGLDYTINDVPIVIINGKAISASNEKAIISDDAFLEVVRKSDKPNIIFFTASGCKECEKVKQLFLNNGIYDNLNVVEVLISADNTYNTQLSFAYTDYFNVKKKHQITPIVYIGDTYYSSAADIEKHIKDISSFSQSTVILDADNYNFAEKSTFAQLLAAFSAGLLNGFNPCSLSMTIMLLSVLIANGKNIKSIGFAYIMGKFIAFVLLGTLLLGVVSKVDPQLLNLITKIFLITLAGILAIMNLIDAINAKKNKLGKIRLQLPESLRKLNHKLIERFGSNSNIIIAVIIGILLGIIVACGEFLCTGQLYIATIAAIAVYSSSAQTIFQILIYSFGFILPLIVIVIVSSRGVSAFKLSNFFREKMYIIKIANTIFFLLVIVLAIFVL